MIQDEPQNLDILQDNFSPPRMRNAIILPDGRKPIPLGSGTVTALLGEGGMANVYEIWNPQLEVHRAVKLLHPNCSGESKQRFETEIKITAKLHHPNIIEIHGVGEWNGLPLIEMEKIDGYTLESLIFDRGALPIPVCTAIGIMISRALHYAHNQVYVIYKKQYHGVIHRDLKPSNIMVCKDGHVKLMDFGIARPTDASIHTTDGSILGTMQYLSPEQLEGKDPDTRTDIYSLGTTLYEALTGVQAFPERNMSKLMIDKIKNDFKPLDDFALKIPPKLKRLIHKCMMTDREKRVGSAEFLVHELEKIHSSLTSETPFRVIRQLGLQSTSEKIVITNKHRFPIRKIGIGFAFVLLAALVFSVGSHIRLRQKESLKQQTAAIIRHSPPPLPEVPEKVPQATIQEEPVKKAKPALKQKQAPAVNITAPEPAKVRKTDSFIDEMKKNHGTEDLIEIQVAEFNKGNYQNAFMLYQNMPAAQSGSDKAVIYHLRTLSELGKTAELKNFLDTHPLNDGEYYLTKAKIQYKTGRINESLQLLEKGLTSPRQFIDSEKFRCEIYYNKALCASSLFDTQPSEITYKNALDAWWQIRNELRSSPNHKYSKIAVEETQRIGEKHRKSKG